MTSWNRDSINQNWRHPITYKFDNEEIKTYCQIKLFDASKKPIDYNIWVDDDLKLNLIKPHQWFLINDIVIDENKKPLLEHITSAKLENIKLKKGTKCY
ncbi:779_t:CDS:2 [Cetraspora pellucida]|uniref:779_t:CDS:1 n=1 Tax=Cetraspora pellucida TaxID=1433469 RepID=A0A9N9K0U2_9GLOM|nr:779_t:CDS:2 [Cetraspora pellucida]